LSVALFPYALLIIVLFQNFFTRNVFTVTAGAGYTREPLMFIVYGIAALYGLIGLIYCLFCRRYLPFNKWSALLSVYILTFAAVAVQLIWPRFLVEMFSTAAGLLLILLQVLRPEESMDPSLGVRSWIAYQEDLKNLIATGQTAGIIAAHIANAQELRNFLGYDRYDSLIREWMEQFQSGASGNLFSRLDVYFERPGIVYVIVEDDAGCEAACEKIMQLISRSAHTLSPAWIRIRLQMCLIRCPDDIKALQDALNLGHRFPLLGRQDQQIFRARDLLHDRDFDPIMHTEDILHRAVTQDSLRIYYQPIFDLKNNRFRSAEALARLIDPEYGMVSPAVFIPAAERSGVIIPLGEMIIESVFRFLSENDIEALGLDFIEINLSVAQCMDRELSNVIFRLQEKYGIDPRYIHFEITETTFDHISSVSRENLEKLSGAGYGFALDDYGTGYSNIQRLSRIEFNIIKIDKTLVDGLDTENGNLIMRNTVRMMHDMKKHVVIEGVETEKALETLAGMSSDFIQGYYYSKPLPEQEFMQFLLSRSEGA
jgi:EAL domain-containing protein (putative c-di-GMP-specific phosphodiesterase class I)